MSPNKSPSKTAETDEMYAKIIKSSQKRKTEMRKKLESGGSLHSSAPGTRQGSRRMSRTESLEDVSQLRASLD